MKDYTAKPQWILFYNTYTDDEELKDKAEFLKAKGYRSKEIYIKGLEVIMAEEKLKEG